MLQYKNLSVTESGPIPAIELHNSSIKFFKLQTLYTRVSSSYSQSMTIKRNRQDDSQYVMMSK